MGRRSCVWATMDGDRVTVARGAPRTHVPSRSHPMGETIAVNRKARHEYTIEDTLEAGLVLTGTEIKSIRAGKVNIGEAHARVERGEAWLVGAHIAPWDSASRFNHERAPRPEAAAPPRPDRPAGGQDQGQGPDHRAPAALHRRPRSGQDRARRGARQAAPRQAPRHRRPRRPPRHAARDWRTCPAGADRIRAAPAIGSRAVSRARRAA